MSNMILFLHSLNSEFPDVYKKTADEIARKMLECFQFPPQGMATRHDRHARDARAQEG